MRVLRELEERILSTPGVVVRAVNLPPTLFEGTETSRCHSNRRARRSVRIVRNQQPELPWPESSKAQVPKQPIPESANSPAVAPKVRFSKTRLNWFSWTAPAVLLGLALVVALSQASSTSSKYSGAVKARASVASAAKLATSPSGLQSREARERVGAPTLKSVVPGSAPDSSSFVRPYDYSQYYDYNYRPPIGHHYVQGYYRRDGTYVSGHFKTDADDSFWNNWSSRGNINPYTGKTGSKVPPGWSMSTVNRTYGYQYPHVIGAGAHTRHREFLFFTSPTRDEKDRGKDERDD